MRRTMNQEQRNAIIEALQAAYWAEFETAMNYLTHATNLDGVRAEEIKKALAADIQVEIGHAQALAGRIKVLGGLVQGSEHFVAQQKSLQPVAKTTDVVHVIKGVIDAEDAAIAAYNKIIKLTDGIDYVTQDLAVTILGDEENHRREFAGFLREYEQ